MADDMSESMDEVLGDEGQAVTERRRTDRRNGGDRRGGGDRRREGPTDYCGPERRSGCGRRNTAEGRLGGISSRRKEDREAFQERIENGELTLEEVEFIRAIDRYKRKYDRPFPTWSEILLIVKQLGYTKEAL